jgi:hypothetical protein
VTRLEPVRIIAHVTPDERPLIEAACRRLASSLAKAAECDWPVHLGFAAPKDAPGRCDFLVCSLMGDVTTATSPAVLEQEWHRQVSSLGNRIGGLIFTTLFRGAPEPHRQMGLIERIRRLNAIVFSVSRAHGVHVADIDRAFAHLGGTQLGTDYRCLGPDARSVASHLLAVTIVRSGALDAKVGTEIQEKMRNSLGNVGDSHSKRGRT